jgi:iron complex transport system ATP-binding protein
MSAPVLRARSLGFAVPGRTLLHAVSFELGGGQLLAVIGPNGAGKTTLARLLCGVLRPDTGSVELGEQPLAGLSRREVARRVAVVPQELALDFPFQVREMVAMGRAPHLGALARERSVDVAAVERSLAELGLTPLATRTFPTLSGGEKQRVLLARARAQEADLLLLDEPTAHMDLGQRLHAFEWLRGWLEADRARRGAVVVTHELELAARFADRVLLLDQGRVAAEGPPAEVLQAERIAEVYQVEARLLEVGGRPHVVAVRSRIHYTAQRNEPDR